MTKDEKNKVANLPDEFTAYRGYCADNGFAEGFSWTLNRAVAEVFAKGHQLKNPEFFTSPVIAERVIDKSELVAYIAGDEDEIIILPGEERI